MTKHHSVANSALLSPFARDVLELYESQLSEVRFPDLDLAALRALAGEVHDAQEEVDRLEGEVRDARDRVAEVSASLHARAERALAYARIFAEGNEQLSELVDGIRKPGAPASTAPKKRGRPRKDDAQLEVLDTAAE